ncbi:hypothetical protein C6503_07635 [Candidatus Poribacteria bacterium]|nr:MAG: hypothetical protein C6503_07635 [Candidatus Poribacteria bacterium]
MRLCPLFVNQLGLTQFFELCYNEREYHELSKTRLSEIESLPDDTIDTSDIPELNPVDARCNCDVSLSAETN